MKIEQALDTIIKSYVIDLLSLNERDRMVLNTNWIKYLKTLPPQELLHDPSIRDKDEMACAMYWERYITSVPPPQELLQMAPLEVYDDEEDKNMCIKRLMRIIQEQDKHLRVLYACLLKQ